MGCPPGWGNIRYVTVDIVCILNEPAVGQCLGREASCEVIREPLGAPDGVSDGLDIAVNVVAVVQRTNIDSAAFRYCCETTLAVVGAGYRSQSGHLLLNRTTLGIDGHCALSAQRRSVGKRSARANVGARGRATV